MNTRVQLTVLLIMLAFASGAYAQEVGDYRSAVNGGQWVTPGTWETWNGTAWVTATNAPSAPYNVTIRSGFSVILDNSGKNCKNLTVEAGATFKTNVALPTSSIRYVRINDSLATINGTFGDSTAGDAIALEAAGVGNTVTITGTGVFAPARVRLNTGARRGTIILDINTKFMYTGSTGTGGIALYPQADSGTITLNAGKTLRFVDQASMAIGSGTSSPSDSGGTFNIYGTVDLSKPNSQIALRVKAGKTGTLNIFSGGSVVVGNKFAVSTIADGGTSAIVVDGSLTAGNQVDFSNPNFVVTGTGTFTLSPGGTLLIGHPQGITSSGATGQIQTAVRDFSAGTSYSYVGTAAQVTGDALPPTVLRLTVNDSLGVTLSQTTAVNGTLILTKGVLSTGTKTLMMLDTGFVSRTNGFVEGQLQKPVHPGTGDVYSFEVGTGTTFSPMTLTFTNVTTDGTALVSAKTGKHPHIGGAVHPLRAVNRYWTVTLGGISFDGFNPNFTFAPTDLDPGADTTLFVVAQEHSGTWTFPTVSYRAGTYLGASGVTTGGDFVIGEPLPVSILVPSNGKGGGVWNDLQTWAWGAVPRHSDSAAVVTNDSVFVEAADSCNTVGVQTGGKLVLDSALAVVNLGVEGTLLKNQGGGLTASGLAAFGKGGYYIHNQAGGSIPTAVWDTNSTCEIRSALGVAPSNGNQNFYNVIWNCPDQSANLNLGWNGNTIGGNITVLASGSGSRWQMMAPKADSTTTVTIMGDVIVRGGQLSTNGTSNANTTVVVHHYGNIDVTGGNFSISRGSQGGSGTAKWYIHQGNFSLANATTQNSNPAGGKFVFQKPGVQTLTLTSATVNALPIQVDSLTTLSMGTSAVRGSGSFTLNNAATLETANTGGLDSTLQMTGTRTISPGASFTFNGTHPQITGVSLPAAVAGMTVDNDSSVTLSDSVTVDSTLSVVHGHLYLNGKVITLGPTAMLHETPGHTVAGITSSDSGVITTTRTLNAPSASVNIAGLGIKIGSSANLGSTVITRGHAVQSNAGQAPISRFFDITPTNNSGLNATMVFAFDSLELPQFVPVSALQLYRSTDSGKHWAFAGGTVNDPAKTLTLTGISALSRWTAVATGDAVQGDPVGVPVVFSLKQNYPNPFNPATTILFTVGQAGRATMELYNILGQKVQTLFDGVAEPGKMHMVKFDGSHLPSGTYFYRLQSEGKSDVKKLMLMK